MTRQSGDRVGGDTSGRGKRSVCKGPVAGGSRGHFKELKEASVARAERAGEGAGVGLLHGVLGISHSRIVTSHLCWSCAQFRMSWGRVRERE